MLRALLLSLLAALFLPLAASLGASTIYWPVISPTSSIPWVRGQKNLLAWRVAGGTGVDAFEIDLHHWNRKVMNGAVKIAARFPNQALPGRYGNLGGQMQVDLAPDVPTGDGFFIAFSSYYHGKVYALSEPFSILDQPPSNYTENPADLPSATLSVTITDTPKATDQFAITLDGKPEAATKSAT